MAPIDASTADDLADMLDMHDEHMSVSWPAGMSAGKARTLLAEHRASLTVMPARAGSATLPARVCENGDETMLEEGATSLQQMLQDLPCMPVPSNTSIRHTHQALPPLRTTHHYPPDTDPDLTSDHDDHGHPAPTTPTQTPTAAPTPSPTPTPTGKQTIRNSIFGPSDRTLNHSVATNTVATTADRLRAHHWPPCQPERLVEVSDIDRPPALTAAV